MAEITKKDLFDTLTEFYGKMIEPEFKAIRGKLAEHDQKFKDILEHFDKIYTNSTILTHQRINASTQ